MPDWSFLVFSFPLLSLSEMYWALCLSWMGSPRTSTRPPPVHSTAPCPYTFGDPPQKTYPCKTSPAPTDVSRTFYVVQEFGALRLQARR